MTDELLSLPEGNPKSGALIFPSNADGVGTTVPTDETAGKAVLNALASAF